MSYYKPKGQVSDQLIIDNVIPILKNGTAKCIANYRTHLCTTRFSNMLMYIRLPDYINKNNITV